MKKAILIIILFFCFIFKTYASETFYLGDHVPNIYIYMDRVNKKVYRQFRMIYKSNTNELVYCIEPGATLSNGNYESYDEYNDVFNIPVDKFNKIKLIAYYGYNYKNHTDIKWYAITQYIIWREIMPSNWDMYFVDQNHNRLDNLFNEEINEIYSLVSNHDDSLNISREYILNAKKNIMINSTEEINNYNINKGYINSNNIVINDLNFGNNEINLSYKDYNKFGFYYSNEGQNILKRGDILKENIHFYIYVNRGKVKIDECNEDNFTKLFIGGTYEILNEDDAVIDEISCNVENCISDYLPIGYYKVRVKFLPDSYEINEYIYDLEIKDNETTKLNICSIPKKESRSLSQLSVLDDTPSTPDEPYEYTVIETKDDDYKTINVPLTYKDSKLKYITLLVILLSSISFLIINNENNN